MEKQKYTPVQFENLLRDALIGIKLSRISRAGDMPLFAFGEIRIVTDPERPDIVRSKGEYDIHTECPFILRHDREALIGSYDMYLDEKNYEYQGKEGLDQITLFDVQAQSIPSLNLIVSDVFFDVNLGLEIRFTDGYILNLYHYGRGLSEFWCFQGKDDLFVCVSEELTAELNPDKQNRIPAYPTMECPEAESLRDIEGEELKYIKLEQETGNLQIFLGEDVSWQDREGRRKKTSRYVLKVNMPFRMLNGDGSILWGSADYLNYRGEYTPEKGKWGMELERLIREFASGEILRVTDAALLDTNEVSITFSNNTVFQLLPHSSCPEQMWWAVYENQDGFGS